MRRTALVVMVMAAIGCHGMAAYRPADGRPITRAEHRGMIQACRSEAQRPLPLWIGPVVIPWRRAYYRDCMSRAGWVALRPEFVEEASPAAAQCGAEVARAIDGGASPDAAKRILDDCMTESGR